MTTRADILEMQGRLIVVRAGGDGEFTDSELARAAFISGPLCLGWTRRPSDMEPAVAQELADYREELKAQHRRELAGAEQAGYERGKREALKAAVKRLREEIPDAEDNVEIDDPADWLDSVVSILEREKL